MERRIEIDWAGNPQLQDAFMQCENGHTITAEVTLVVTERRDDGLVGRVLKVGTPTKVSPDKAMLPTEAEDIPLPTMGGGDALADDPAVLVVLDRKKSRDSKEGY